MVLLKDYKPPQYKIPKIDLEISIEEEYVRVVNTMEINVTSKQESLFLKGKDLELEELVLDGNKINADQYEIIRDELIIKKKFEGQFIIKITTKIYPFNNKSLEGLYKSGDLLTTQCEAEGFRRITYHPDRPDVLSKFKVRIEAEEKRYPKLLSNGNLIKTGISKTNYDRHYVIWEDPFPKPSYLFALVAGDLVGVKDIFITSSKRRIDLTIYTERGDENYTSHAISSLKRAMKWEEDIYNLEYDLNEYNIVAVRHFNMGAMENKSLNIFNSKLILANDCIATDEELTNIESVIAHEYFHNWTGNRITCRDWFQLSLKEGLTVFRDQSFTEDNHSQAAKRVEDVITLRNYQFHEDSGPTAHPVKPKEYKEIENFYTTTIYEKGAEIIRMLRVLLGHEQFMKGIREYINEFDGTATTTDNFILSVARGASKDDRQLSFKINQFKNWYDQSGTPEVIIEKDWDPIQGILTVGFKQVKPLVDNKKELYPLVIPILYSIIDSMGNISKETLLILDEYNSKVSIKGLEKSSKAPSLSIFRNFSAPVKVTIRRSTDELLELFEKDNDAFARWDSGQRLMTRILTKRTNVIPDNSLEDQFIFALKNILNNTNDNDPTTIATLIGFPGINELEDHQNLIDPINLYNAIKSFKRKLGLELKEDLLELHNKCKDSWSLDWPKGKGERSLTKLIWSWLIESGDISIRQEAINAVNGRSMTLSKAAINALLQTDCEERKIALDIFYNRWKDMPIVLDSWFRFKASIPNMNELDDVKEVISNSRFDRLAPNAIRAVLGGLISNIPVFHNPNGQGYDFLANQIIAIDRDNPSTSSKLIKVFSKWKSYIPINRDKMKESLDNISSRNLSSRSREVIELIIK